MRFSLGEVFGADPGRQVGRPERGGEQAATAPGAGLARDGVAEGDAGGAEQGVGELRGEQAGAEQREGRGEHEERIAGVVHRAVAHRVDEPVAGQEAERHLAVLGEVADRRDVEQDDGGDPGEQAGEDDGRQPRRLAALRRGGGRVGNELGGIAGEIAGETGARYRSLRLPAS